MEVKDRQCDSGATVGDSGRQLQTSLRGDQSGPRPLTKRAPDRGTDAALSRSSRLCCEAIQSVISPETLMAITVTRLPGRLAPTHTRVAVRWDRPRVLVSPGARRPPAFLPATDSVRRIGARAAHTVLRVRPAGRELLPAVSVRFQMSTPRRRVVGK